jgi:hypothetical protein
MKILLGDFNAKVDREDIFQPTIGNESVHEISNDNGVRVPNFATDISQKTFKNKGVCSALFLDIAQLGSFLPNHIYLLLKSYLINRHFHAKHEDHTQN